MFACTCVLLQFYFIRLTICLTTADRRPILLILVSSYAGKVVNIRRLDEVIDSINGWYMERGLFGLVSISYMLN